MVELKQRNLDSRKCCNYVLFFYIFHLLLLHSSVYTISVGCFCVCTEMLTCAYTPYEYSKSSREKMLLMSEKLLTYLSVF